MKYKNLIFVISAVILTNALIGYAASTVVQVPQGGTGLGNIQSGTLLVGNGTGKLATTTNASVSGWTFDTNFNQSVLTASTSIPVWIKNSLYASSTSIFQGLASFGNASTSQISASNSYLGTVLSGTWNGTVIDVPYGGTGGTTFPVNTVLMGDGTSALIASTSPTLSSINLTSSATSSFTGNVLVKGNLQVDGKFFAPVTLVTGGDLDMGTHNITNAGTITATTLAGTLSTAAQTNITSLGTLTGLTVTNAPIFSALTPGRIPYASTAGLLADSSALLWNNTASRLTTTYASSTAITTSGGAWFATSGGNVGIGTTSPNALLDVNGQLLTGSIIKRSLDSSFTILEGGSTGTSGAAISLYGRDHATQAGNSYLDAGGYDSTGFIQFRQTNTAGTATNLMRITSAGNVGIGTTSPADKLDVAGGIRFGTAAFTAGVGKLYTSATLGTVLTGNTGSTNDMTIATAAGNFLIANPTGTNNTVLNPTIGNVGIGTTTPLSKLHVSAGAAATTTVEFDERITTSKTCFNVRDALGAQTSFYFRGTTMVIEAKACL